MIGLTARQLAVLRFVAGYIEAQGRAPTLVEIASSLGWAARSGAFHVLTGLQERGAVRRVPNRTRQIEVLHPVPIPRAPHGQPLYFVKVRP